VLQRRANHSLLFLISHQSAAGRVAEWLTLHLQPCPRANGRHLYLVPKRCHSSTVVAVVAPACARQPSVSCCLVTVGGYCSAAGGATASVRDVAAH
jgi:hypothetical protein